MQPQILGQFLDAGRDIHHAVKIGEGLQILPDRQPHRDIDIRTLEIDPVDHIVAVAHHVHAENANIARGRQDETEQLAMVVVLPAPLPPSSAVIEPCRISNVSPFTASTSS
jgi:hypothetical protein